MAICFTPAQASAQVLAGKFTLPFEAHWGLATLPAGDYSFTVQGIGREAKVQLFHDDASVAYIVNRGFDFKPLRGISLTVVRTSDGNFVRDLNLSQIGEVLHYAPHTQRGSAAREREIAPIPVTAESK